MRDVSFQVQRGLDALGGLLRRSELMLFVPALTLGAFWLGGETALIGVALGLPMLLVLAGAFRENGAAAGQEPGGLTGRALRPQIVGALDAALKQAAEGGLTTACLVLQFDDSARILERHGRAAQADLLQQSSDRICAALRQGDTVARLEGGGLAVALGAVRRLDVETLIQVAARLQKAVAPPLTFGVQSVFVTCSVGFCLSGRAPEQTGRSLLDAAQVAADDALRHGPGAIRAFAPEMARTRADRDAQREVLEAALDEGQIRAHFQPQISTDTGALTGFEALARWYHPERGLVSPGEFLPLLEEAGLSERLCEVMLFNAFSALTQWDKAGLHVPNVAVNFSPAELRNPRLAEKLKWELDRFSLTPDRLTIEVLETVVAQTDNDVIVANIRALADLGCGIDLDDFGTGHASITNIRRFPVKRLKVDRSFVTHVDEDREQQKMVSAILSLAEQLGLDTLAEGVETPGEHAMLAQLGCAHVQGFGIGRPIPFEETADWMIRNVARMAATPRITHRAG